MLHNNQATSTVVQSNNDVTMGGMNMKFLKLAVLVAVAAAFFALNAGSALAGSTPNAGPAPKPACVINGKINKNYHWDAKKGKCVKNAPKKTVITTIVGPDGSVAQVVSLSAKADKVVDETKKCSSHARKREQVAPPRDPLAKCVFNVHVVAKIDAKVACQKGWMGGESSASVRIDQWMRTKAFSQTFARGNAEAWATSELRYRLKVDMRTSVTCVRVTPPPVVTPPVAVPPTPVPQFGHLVVAKTSNYGVCVPITVANVQSVTVCSGTSVAFKVSPGTYTVSESCPAPPNSNTQWQCQAAQTVTVGANETKYVTFVNTLVCVPGTVGTVPNCVAPTTPPATPAAQPPMLSNPTNPEEIYANGEPYPNVCITVSGKNGNSLTVSFGSRYGSWQGGTTATFTSNGVDRVCKTYVAPRDASVVGKYEQFTFNVHDNTSGLNGQEVRGLEFPIKAPPARP